MNPGALGENELKVSRSGRFIIGAKASDS